MVTPYNSEQKYLYDLKKRVFTGKGLSIDRSSVQEKLKFALCSRLRSAIPYPSEAFAKQESQHQFIFVCPGYCVQQFLCILQPVLPSCGMLGVHSLKKKEKKKKKSVFHHFFPPLPFAAGSALPVRRQSVAPWIPVEPWSFLQILSWFCPLLAKSAENPAHHASQCLLTGKSHRSFWAFDIESFSASLESLTY